MDLIKAFDTVGLCREPCDYRAAGIKKLVSCVTSATSLKSFETGGVCARFYCVLISRANGVSLKGLNNEVCNELDFKVYQFFFSRGASRSMQSVKVRFWSIFFSEKYALHTLCVISII